MPNGLLRVGVLLAFPFIASFAAADDQPRATPAAASPEEIASFLSGWAAAEGTAKDPTTGYPKRVQRTKDRMVMVLVPAGTFQMGALPSDSLAQEDEKPRHAVTLSKAYYLDESEVTIGMWKRFAAAKGSRAPKLPQDATDKHPIRQLTWTEIEAYLTWARVQLPTEAQWERAAKGGDDDFIYPWGPRDQADLRNGSGADDGYEGLSPVKSFSPNAYELYDMSGNVWELCSDWYDAGYYAVSPPQDPSGPRAPGAVRVIRGGMLGYVPPGREERAWRDREQGSLRATFRGVIGVGSQELHKDRIGFRGAKTLP